MLTRPKPGTIVWCAECGVVKRLEVVSERSAKGRNKQFHDEVCVRYPNDDVVLPWYCWLGFLSENEIDAVKLAIEQLMHMIASNDQEIKDLRKDNKELRRQIAQFELIYDLKETSNGLAKT